MDAVDERQVSKCDIGGKSGFRPESAIAGREFVAGGMSKAHRLRCNAPAFHASGRFTEMFTPRGIFLPAAPLPLQP
jgi:hypothetical protein